MQHLLKNTADLSKHRIEIFNGEEHLVIPVVAAVQGVLNDQFLSIPALEASLAAWEGAAVTMSHPKQFGEDVSANSQFSLENFVVGRFFNAFIEDNKFKGEFWINLETLSEHEDGALLLELVEAGETIEVSTAYWCTTDNRGGIYDGIQYTGVQTNIIPNHIAILLHEIGACSIADGCGAPRMNQEAKVAKKKEKITANCDDGERIEGIMNKLRQKFGNVVMNAFSLRGGDGIELNRISHDQIRKNLREILASSERSDSFVFIVDVFDDEVIYGRELPNGEVDLFSRNYVLGSSPGYEVTLEDPVEVEQVVSYEPISNSYEEENAMDRDALIERLATNEATPFNREQLTDLSDEQLQYMVANLETPSTEDPEKGQKVDDKSATSEKEDGNDGEGSEGTVQNLLSPEVAEALNALGADGIKDIQNSAAALAEERKTEKDSIVSKLIANEGVTIDEATLRRMDLEALQGVARMAGVSVNYAGAGGPIRNSAEESKGPPAPPSIVLPDSE